MMSIPGCIGQRLCDRFHKAILQDFYEVAFKCKIYRSTEEVQASLDDGIDYYNNERTHYTKIYSGRAPIHIFVDGKEMCRDKLTALDSLFWT